MIHFTNSQVNGLIDVIENTHWFFVAAFINPELVPKRQMKDLIKMGFRKSQIMKYPELALQFGALSIFLKDKDLKGISFEQLKKIVKAKKFLPMSLEEKFALKNIEERSLGDIKGLGNRISNITHKIMVEVDAKQRANYERIIKDASIRAIKKRESVKFIAREIAEKTGDWVRDWDRIGDYILHDAFDTGRILATKKQRGGQAKVWKRVHLLACSSCKRLYIKNQKTGEPRIFTVDELLSNGSNIGRKKEDWLPSSSPLHPYCFLNPKSKVYTSKGYKNISEIKKGDLVLTHKGRFRKVIKLFRHFFDIKRDKIYNLTFLNEKNGIKFSVKGVTGNHPFKTINGYKKVDDLVLGDLLYSLYSGCENCRKSISLHWKEKYNRITKEIECCGKCKRSLAAKKRWKDPEYRKGMLIAAEKGRRTQQKPMNKKRHKEVLRMKFENMSLEKKQALTKNANIRIREMWKNGELEHVLENLKKGKKSYTYLEKKVQWLLEDMGVKFEQQKMVERNVYTNSSNPMGIRKKRFYLSFLHFLCSMSQTIIFYFKAVEVHGQMVDTETFSTFSLTFS